MLQISTKQINQIEIKERRPKNYRKNQTIQSNSSQLQADQLLMLDLGIQRESAIKMEEGQQYPDQIELVQQRLKQLQDGLHQGPSTSMITKAGAAHSQQESAGIIAGSGVVNNSSNSQSKLKSKQGTAATMVPCAGQSKRQSQSMIREKNQNFHYMQSIPEQRNSSLSHKYEQKPSIHVMHQKHKQNKWSQNKMNLNNQDLQNYNSNSQTNQVQYNENTSPQSKTPKNNPKLKNSSVMDGAQNPSQISLPDFADTQMKPRMVILPGQKGFQQQQQAQMNTTIISEGWQINANTVPQQQQIHFSETNGSALSSYIKNNPSILRNDPGPGANQTQEQYTLVGAQLKPQSAQKQVPNLKLAIQEKIQSPQIPVCSDRINTQIIASQNNSNQVLLTTLHNSQQTSQHMIAGSSTKQNQYTNISQQDQKLVAGGVAMDNDYIQVNDGQDILKMPGKGDFNQRRGKKPVSQNDFNSSIETQKHARADKTFSSRNNSKKNDGDENNQNPLNQFQDDSQQNIKSSQRQFASKGEDEKLDLGSIMSKNKDEYQANSPQPKRHTKHAPVGTLKTVLMKSQEDILRAQQQHQSTSNNQQKAFISMNHGNQDFNMTMTQQHQNDTTPDIINSTNRQHDFEKASKFRKVAGAAINGDLDRNATDGVSAGIGPFNEAFKQQNSVSNESQQILQISGRGANNMLANHLIIQNDDMLRVQGQNLSNRSHPNNNIDGNAGYQGQNTQQSPQVNNQSIYDIAKLDQVFSQFQNAQKEKMQAISMRERQREMNDENKPAKYQVNMRMGKFQGCKTLKDRRYSIQYKRAIQRQIEQNFKKQLMNQLNTINADPNNPITIQKSTNIVIQQPKDSIQTAIPDHASQIGMNSPKRQQYQIETTQGTNAQQRENTIEDSENHCFKNICDNNLIMKAQQNYQDIAVNEIQLKLNKKLKSSTHPNSSIYKFSNSQGPHQRPVPTDNSCNHITLVPDFSKQGPRGGQVQNKYPPSQTKSSKKLIAHSSGNLQAQQQHQDSRLKGTDQGLQGKDSELNQKMGMKEQKSEESPESKEGKNTNGVGKSEFQRMNKGMLQTFQNKPTHSFRLKTDDGQEPATGKNSNEDGDQTRLMEGNSEQNTAKKQLNQSKSDMRVLKNMSSNMNGNMIFGGNAVDNQKMADQYLSDLKLQEMLRQANVSYVQPSNGFSPAKISGSHKYSPSQGQQQSNSRSNQKQKNIKVDMRQQANRSFSAQRYISQLYPENQVMSAERKNLVTNNHNYEQQHLLPDSVQPKSKNHHLNLPQTYGDHIYNQDENASLNTNQLEKDMQSPLSEESIVTLHKVKKQRMGDSTQNNRDLATVGSATHHQGLADTASGLEHSKRISFSNEHINMAHHQRERERLQISLSFLKNIYKGVVSGSTKVKASNGIAMGPKGDQQNQYLYSKRAKDPNTCINQIDKHRHKMYETQVLTYNKLKRLEMQDKILRDQINKQSGNEERHEQVDVTAMQNEGKRGGEIAQQDEDTFGQVKNDYQQNPEGDTAVVQQNNDKFIKMLEDKLSQTKGLDISQNSKTQKILSCSERNDIKQMRQKQFEEQSQYSKTQKQYYAKMNKMSKCKSIKSGGMVTQTKYRPQARSNMNMTIGSGKNFVSQLGATLPNDYHTISAIKNSQQPNKSALNEEIIQNSDCDGQNLGKTNNQKTSPGIGSQAIQTQSQNWYRTPSSLSQTKGSQTNNNYGQFTLANKDLQMFDYSKLNHSKNWQTNSSQNDNLGQQQQSQNRNLSQSILNNRETTAIQNSNDLTAGKKKNQKLNSKSGGELGGYKAQKIQQLKKMNNYYSTNPNDTIHSIKVGNTVENGQPMVQNQESHTISTLDDFAKVQKMMTHGVILNDAQYNQVRDPAENMVHKAISFNDTISKNDIRNAKRQGIMHVRDTIHHKNRVMDAFNTYEHHINQQKQRNIMMQQNSTLLPVSNQSILTPKALTNLNTKHEINNKTSRPSPSVGAIINHNTVMVPPENMATQGLPMVCYGPKNNILSEKYSNLNQFDSDLQNNLSTLEPPSHYPSQLQDRTQQIRSSHLPLRSHLGPSTLNQGSLIKSQNQPPLSSQSKARQRIMLLKKRQLIQSQQAKISQQQYHQLLATGQDQDYNPGVGASPNQVVAKIEHRRKLSSQNKIENQIESEQNLHKKIFGFRQELMSSSGKQKTQLMKDRLRSQHQAAALSYQNSHVVSARSQGFGSTPKGGSGFTNSRLKYREQILNELKESQK